MYKHTSGPWVSHSGAVYQQNWKRWPDIRIALMDREEAETMPGSQQDANARLCAAAPDLLEALREVVGEWDSEAERLADHPGYGFLSDTGGIIIAREAIAKAEGGEQ